MAIKFLSPIDLNLNDLENAVVHLLATDPVSPVEGQLWYNTTSHLVKYYNGTSTIVLYDASTAATASKLVLRDSNADIAARIATFQSVTLSGSVTNATDAATKAYVDATKQGLDVKDSVRVATAAALPANTRTTNVLTADANGSINVAGIDSVTDLALDDRVLVKNEATGANNGFYYVTAVGSAGAPWTLTRATDADVSAEVTGGAYVFVNEGTTNADSGWVLTTNDPITLNTTALTFTQFTGAGLVTAGAGLTKTGNTLDVITASSGRIVVNADSIDLATVVSAGTATAITYDAYGRVTVGADIVSSNGLVTKTTAGTFTARTMTGTADKITITNGDGVSGNPTFTIASTYAGQTSIITLGTITTGVWTGTTIAIANGGTGATTATAAFDALSPMTTLGDTIYGGASGTRTRLAGNTSATRKLLSQTGNGSVSAAPAWDVLVQGDLPATSAKAFAATITGDASTTTFTVTHNLGTQDVVVAVRELSADANRPQNWIENKANGVNTVQILFAVAPANAVTYRVTVVGV